MNGSSSFKKNLRFWFPKDQWLEEKNKAFPVLRTTDIRGFYIKYEERLTFIEHEEFTQHKFFDEYILALLKQSVKNSLDYELETKWIRRETYRNAIL